MIMIIKPLIYLGLAAISSVSFCLFPQKCAASCAAQSGTSVLRGLQFRLHPVRVPTQHSSINRPLSEYRGELRNWSLRTWDGST